MLRRVTLLPLVCAAALAAGCSDEPTTNPTPQDPVPVSEVFSGTVAVSGAFVQPFAVERAGSVTAQLTAVSAGADAVVGLALGTWNGTSCQLVITNDAAKQSSAILGTATSTGTLCVRVFDVGSLAGATDVEVTVQHF